VTQALYIFPCREDNPGRPAGTFLNEQAIQHFLSSLDEKTLHLKEHKVFEDCYFLHGVTSLLGWLLSQKK